MHPLIVESTASLPTALLVHHVDGSSHHDWLLSPVEHPMAEDRCVITYRMHRPLNQLVQGQTERIHRIPDHRGFYLDLPGPRQLDSVKGRNRGTVTPVDHGFARMHATGDGWTDIQIRWDRAGTVQMARIHHGDDGVEFLEIMKVMKSGDPYSQGAC